MHIENIVIGKTLCTPMEMFALNNMDWENVEKEKTYYTEERNFPRLLVEIGAAPSASEVRRNRKDLIKTLDSLDYLEIKYGKRRFYILVGN